MPLATRPLLHTIGFALASVSLFVDAAAQTAPLPASEAPAADTTAEPVIIDFAEVYERIVDGDNTYQRFAGEVELRQGELFIYADEAVVRDDDFVRAIGNVVLLQNDTLQLFADSMRYYAGQELAFLYGNVVLVNGEQQLFTDSLRYDLANRRARYTSRAKLTDGRAQLSSMRGTYDAAAKLASFRDSVFVVGEDFSLISDTMRFATEARVVYFDGPTLIATPASRIYAEDGYYDMLDSLGVFRDRAQVARGTQRAMAAEIHYDGVADEFQLVGDARFVDEGRRAVGDTIRYFEATDRTELLGDAVFVDGDQRVDGDRVDYDGAAQTFTSIGRVRISEPPYLLVADSVSFDDSLGLAFVHGGVEWIDTSERRSIIAEDVIYRRDGEYVRAFGGRPVFTMVVEGDSLHLRADTLLSYREPYSSYEGMRAVQAASVAAGLVDSTRAPKAIAEPTGGLAGATPSDSRSPASPQALSPMLDSTDASLVALDSGAAEPIKPGALTMAATDGDSVFTSLDTSNLNTSDARALAAYHLSSSALRQNALDSAGQIVAVNRLDPNEFIGPLLTDTSIITDFLRRRTDSLRRASLPDSVRSLLAYRDVRLYKSDLQAVGDSMAFNSIDSAFTLFGTPLVWSDTSQFAADTITIKLRDQVVDQVFLRSKAFIVNSTDEQFFNQIKGRRVDVDFAAGEIDRMKVRGNAESVYYILDEAQDYIGVNHVRSARMRMQFLAGELSDIYFYDQPEGALEPIPPTNATPKLLEDFRWEEVLRPKSRAELQ